MEDPRKDIIEHYLNSYNRFDVDGMIRDLHPDITFENVSGGEVTMKLNGIGDFRKQAEDAVRYFQTRKQTVHSWQYEGNRVIAMIEYKAVLAIDLPNGMRAGETLRLQGRSEFTFEGLTIVYIKDVS